MASPLGLEGLLSFDCRVDYGKDFNMVEWDGDSSGGRGSMISGLEKKAWCQRKETLQIFYPNWRQKGLDCGGWFTSTNYRQVQDKVQARHSTGSFLWPFN